VALLALLWQGETPPAAAQERRLASPRGFSATETAGYYDRADGYLGGKWIEIEYGRPIKRGRSLFEPPDFMVILNGGAPVWRAGANQSTVLKTEAALEIGGTTVPPGEYTLFIELRREQWTLIVSTWPAQKKYEQTNRDALFGAYHYRPDRDVVRTRMELERLPYSFDQLSWQFLDMTDDSGRLAILWDDRMASVPFAILSD
jgi:hypothetical protein